MAITNRYRLTRELREEYLNNIGLNSADIVDWVYKWSNLRSNSVYCDFKLSFDQYIQLAVDAGLTSPNQIGHGSDSYCMGRLGDRGDYELGNCRFITQKQNQQERVLNGGSEISAAKKRGTRKETHESVRSQSDKNSKNYILIDPNGEEHRIRNLNEFCKNRGLNQGNMCAMINGGNKHCKGWTGKIL